MIPHKETEGRAFCFFMWLCYALCMSRDTPIITGEYYHVYNRGVDKRVIFKDKFEYLRFITLLYICNSKKEVDVHNYLKKKEGPTFFSMLNEERGVPLTSVGVYCLMPNHFHLLLKEGTEGGISMFMRKLSTAYAMFFNSKHNRSGTLFEGRYKIKHIDSDEQLKYLYSYIHLNPIKLIDKHWKENGVSSESDAKKYLDSYQYSSYQCYVGKETLQNNIINKSAFPSYFSTHADFKAMVNNWLGYK